MIFDQGKLVFGHGKVVRGPGKVVLAVVMKSDPWSWLESLFYNGDVTLATWSMDCSKLYSIGENMFVYKSLIMLRSNFTTTNECLMRSLKVRLQTSIEGIVENPISLQKLVISNQLTQGIWSID